MTKLDELLTAGAAPLEIAAALPYVNGQGFAAGLFCCTVGTLQSRRQFSLKIARRVRHT